MICIGVDYDEFKPNTYRGCVVTLSDNYEIGFRSGNFEADMRDARVYALNTAGDGEPVMYLSSVDNYRQDVAQCLHGGAEICPCCGLPKSPAKAAESEGE